MSAEKVMVGTGKLMCRTWNHTWAGVLLCTKPPHGTDEPHEDEEIGVEWTHDGVLLPAKAAQAERAREGGSLTVAIHETPERRRQAVQW